MMADSTLDAKYITLFDAWPGKALDWGLTVSQILDSNTVQNVVYPRYPVGTKIIVRNPGTTYSATGNSTLIYLQAGTAATGLAVAAKHVCVPDTDTNLYKVTNDKTTGLNPAGCPLVAVALTTMTNSYYGWYWCGGVCPADLLVNAAGSFILSGNMATDSTVAIGPIQTVALTAANIGFALAASATTTLACGWALHADA